MYGRLGVSPSALQGCDLHFRSRNVLFGEGGDGDQVCAIARITTLQRSVAIAGDNSVAFRGTIERTTRNLGNTSAVAPRGNIADAPPQHRSSITAIIVLGGLRSVRRRGQDLGRRVQGHSSLFIRILRRVGRGLSQVRRGRGRLTTPAFRRSRLSSPRSSSRRLRDRPRAIAPGGSAQDL